MIGGRLYRVSFAAVSITVQQDLFYLKPAADKPIRIEGIFIGTSGGNADAGDAQEELFDIQVIDLAATVTASAGGSAFTPLPDMPSDAAAGFTARVNDTTKATTSGASRVRHPDGMNSRSPWTVPWPPEHWIWVFNPNALVVRLNTTPADAILESGVAIVRELG